MFFIRFYHLFFYIIALLGLALPPTSAQHSYLIKQGNIINVETGDQLMNRFLVIENGLIKSISQKRPKGDFTLEIDAKDKFILPGLINMYTHVNEDNLLLYLANGQTTVRDAPSHLTALGLREKIKKGDLLGPRIYAVGLRATGMPAPYQSQQPIRTEAEAVAQVREAKRLGYDGLFIYGSCDPETYVPLLNEAQKLALPVSGHFPQYVALDKAINTQQRSFDNLTGLLRRGNLRVDKEALFKGLLESGQAVIPTMTVHRLWSLSDRKDSVYQLIPKEYISPKLKANWLPITNGKGSYPYHEVAALIKEMYERGIRLLIGSDGGYPLVVNGFSFHDELCNFSELGIPNLEILRMATILPALHLGFKDLGLVKENYKADLLILNKNPLENLSHLKAIDYLFVQGKPIAGKILEDKLKYLAEDFTHPKDRFAPWAEVTVNWDQEHTHHYEIKNNGIIVGEEKINIFKTDDRNFTLEAINVMDGPDKRTSYLYAQIKNKIMDSLYVKTITPEGVYEATIATTKTKALIAGRAPFHGAFKYEEDLPYGTLLLGPFTSRYYELDMVANYVLAMLLKRSRLGENQADQLPVIQIELNSEEYGKNLIVDRSDYTILNMNGKHYKIIYNTFSGYRTITAPAFVIDVFIDSQESVTKIKSGEKEMVLK